MEYFNNRFDGRTSWTQAPESQTAAGNGQSLQPSTLPSVETGLNQFKILPSSEAGPNQQRAFPASEAASNQARTSPTSGATSNQPRTLPSSEAPRLQRAPKAVKAKTV